MVSAETSDALMNSSAPGAAAEALTHREANFFEHRV
jgi:hypothetical protein